MKAIIVSFLLISSYASAGQVYTINPGQTFPLGNGDIVACIDNQSQPTTITRCRGFAPGSPAEAVCGFGADLENATTHLYENCHQLYRGNSREQMCEPMYMKYSVKCESISPNQIGVCPKI